MPWRRRREPWQTPQPQVSQHEPPAPSSLLKEGQSRWTHGGAWKVPMPIRNCHDGAVHRVVVAEHKQTGERGIAGYFKDLPDWRKEGTTKTAPARPLPFQRHMGQLKELQKSMSQIKDFDN